MVVKQQQVAHATVELVLFTADLNLLGNGERFFSQQAHVPTSRALTDVFPPYSLLHCPVGSEAPGNDMPKIRSLGESPHRRLGTPPEKGTLNRGCYSLSLTEEDGQAWVFRICN